MALAEPIIPPALRKGDTIALISPSGRLNDIFPDRIDRAVSFLTSLGFKVTIIFNSKLSDDFPTALFQRRDELHQAFADPTIKAIISTIGGLSANEIIPHLDYDLIRANPKIFCGFSDITLFHHALYVKAGLRTFYGPAAITQWGEYPQPLDFTTKNFLKVVSADNPDNAVGSVPRSTQWVQEHLDWNSPESSQRARRLDASPQQRWLRPGKGQGRLFGGCLPSVVQLGGTQYMPSYAGKVLFLETPEGDGPDSPFGLDFARSSMADLRNLGILQDIVGLVVGRPFQYTDSMREKYEKMTLDLCYGTDYPILCNVDIGHTDPILTLPLGAMVSLDSEKDSFEILEPGVVS